MEPMRETEDDDDDVVGEFVFGSEYEDGEVAEDEEEAMLLPPYPGSKRDLRFGMAMEDDMIVVVGVVVWRAVT